MSRISGGQFIAMLLITDLFALFCLTGNVTFMTVTGFAIATVIQFFMSIPAVKFYNSGGSLKSSGKIIEFLYLLYLILWGGLLFVMLWNVTEVIYIPYDNLGILPGKLLISGLIAITCLYTSSPGTKSLSRSAVIAMVLGVLCIAIVFISAISAAKWENFIYEFRTSDLISEILRGFVISGGLGNFVLLLGFTNGKSTCFVRRYFIFKLILLTVVTLSAIFVAGGIMQITDFPVITAAQLAQPFSSQRIDSLFLIVFVILAVFSITVQTVSASYLLKRVIPSARRFRSTIMLILMISSAFFLKTINMYNVVYSLIAAAFLFILPLLMLIKKSGGK